MVYSQQGQAHGQGQGFSRIDSADERAGESRPVGYGDGVNLVESYAGVAERAAQGGLHVADMLAGSKLGNHAAVGRVQGRLRGDDV